MTAPQTTRPAGLDELVAGIRELSRTVAVLVEKVDRIDRKLNNNDRPEGVNRP